MTRLTSFPINLFTSQRKFNDYNADDMKCGDLTEYQLKNSYFIYDVSNIVDPFTLSKKTGFNNPQSMFAGVYGNNHQSSVNKKQCADLLFDELRATSLPFAFYGQYRHLINKMFTHLQKNTGENFEDSILHKAYKNLILNNITKTSAFYAIKDTINQYITLINTDEEYFLVDALSSNLKKSVLPKFDAFSDKFNGMAISIHDVHATKIDLLNIEVSKLKWRAEIKFTAQDHFGLDDTDINNKKFSQFQFFKAWFILQRYERFAYRPFFTDMQATVTLEGSSR
ncbi:DUF3289 family protein [Cronobacter dublinensis]|uniref:DUF3289 family protein n=1 Tax=Cronobacter dublinensis TaxID=413497 RepID=UPI0013754B3F|nr:DUF3289 family protein [Cronobacter dublinensis]NCH58264.1 DUF3289 family protein [Cronobacter dublinensis]